MKKTMHMIGNAHLDPVWLWNWREGFQENKATLKSALDRMEEFDDFIFTSSSAQFLSGWKRTHRICLKKSSSVLRKDAG